MNVSVDKIITEARIETLKAKGVLIFDVDDTLLARRDGSTAKGETFAESRAAMMLPDLIRAGIRVALITGHGWDQLHERMVAPLLHKISEEPMELGERFFAYANRGATRINFDDDGWRLDADYARVFRFAPEELATLTAILTELTEMLGPYTHDVKIECREDSILSLRTVAKEIPKWESVRQQLVTFGQKRLEEKGLRSRFQIAAAGKNSVEIASDSASKTYACADLFARVGDIAGCTADEARTASLYIGDEFEPGGNDGEVAIAYPDLKSISVGQNARLEQHENIIHIHSDDGSWGPDVTREIIASILKVLD